MGRQSKYFMDPAKIMENLKENMREDLRKKLEPRIREAIQESLDKAIAEVIQEAITSINVVLRPHISGKGNELVFVIESGA